MAGVKGLAMGIAAVAGLAGAAVFKVTPGAMTESVPPLKTGRVTGTVLPVWNGPGLYAGIQRGLSEPGFRLFRFPNGSLSNEYHWNGAGTLDSVGIWHPDPSKALPGFLTTTRYRGTTKSNYGSVHYSHVTDGVDSTLWWSDPWAGPETWVTLNLGGGYSLDSVRIAWGSLRPDSVLVGSVETSNYNAYRGRDAKLIPLARVAVTGAAMTIPVDSAVAQFLVVKPLGVGAQGVQIGEVEAWSDGARVTVNAPDQAEQTPVAAMGAHPGGERTTGYDGTGTPSWTFDLFLDYIKTFPGAEALITVNYGTGTPEEAAAWVKYANVDRNLGIKLWQVGNEMDGAWEEGGPVDARQYATKFLAFARAMKAVDPTIQVLGPVQAGMDFAVAASGHLDGTAWTEEVLRIVGEAEAKDGKRYLDGFDFHAYPYWTAGKPNPSSALAAQRKLKGNLDTLAAMMARHLKDPGSRLVCMSEFNVSVVTMDLMMRPENATGTAMMLGQLVDRFGGNAMSIVWDSYEGGGANPDGSTGGTWGALTLFVNPKSGSASSIGYAPNSPFWGNWTTSRLWAIDSARPMALSVSGTQLEARALSDGRDTSYLLLNMLSTPCTTQVANVPSRGWIFSFGQAHYTWNGTTSEAWAFPNSGPSGRPVPASWDGRLVIPPYGMAVVRTSAPWAFPEGEGHVVQFAVARQELEFGDTLKVSGTILRAPDAPVPSAVLGDTSIALLPLDGAWDSPEEAFVLKVPSEVLGESQSWLRIGSRDSVLVTVTGKLRPTLWIDRFDDNSTASDQPSKARWSHSAAGGLPSTTAVSFPDRLEGGKSLRIGTHLEQPSDLGYAVYGEARLNLDDTVVSKSVGIQFDWRSFHSAGGSFNLQISSDTVKNYDDYLVSLPTTVDSSWTTVRLRWSAFQQAGWGGVLTGPLLARQVNRLNFRAAGEGDAMFGIDNLVYLQTSGDSVITSVRERSAPAGWSVRRGVDGWIIQVPAGATVSLVGLDGRRQAVLSSQRGESMRYRPRGSGVVYAVLELDGRRETRLLPVLR